MICVLLIFLLFLLGVRVIYLIHDIHRGKRKVTWKRSHPLKTAIIIGSGGHTTEMISLMRNLNAEYYSPRYYIMASTDTSSEVKIHGLETLFYSACSTDYEIIKIPRSRVVGQSYITSVFTTLYSLIASFPLILKRRPELIICNGPGTCIPICVVAFLLRILCVTKTKIVFVESICRVKTLSLTGKILLLFADEIIVQWALLQEVYKRTKYIGRLV